jgi:hypothetical protein
MPKEENHGPGRNMLSYLKKKKKKAKRAGGMA